jgi:hypothetical protein
MKYFSGYGIKVEALEGFDGTDTGTLKCHLKKDNNTVVNCQHLQTNGNCKNKFFYHYCKHIVKAKDEGRIALLRKYNFTRNEKFNSEADDVAVISEKQYKDDLKNYLSESKLMFPRFSEDHSNANYVALAFCEEINDITPILVIGKELSKHDNPRFNTFYLIESQFVHYNFIIAFALRFSDILKNKESLTYGLTKNEIKVNTNDIVNNVFENPLLFRKQDLLITYINEITKRNFLNYKKSNLETINLFQYFIKKWNLNNDYEKILTLPVDYQDRIYQKIKSQPESIMNLLESKLVDDSESLVEFSLFYTLLQLKIASQDNSERNITVSKMIERAKKTSEFASILLDIFI